MKILGIDYAIKHIRFKDGEDEYHISFRQSVRKGVYNVHVLKNGGFVDLKEEDIWAFPGALGIAEEIWHSFSREVEKELETGDRIRAVGTVATVVFLVWNTFFRK